MVASSNVAIKLSYGGSESIRYSNKVRRTAATNNIKAAFLVIIMM